MPLSLKEMGYEGRWQFRGGLIRDLWGGLIIEAIRAIGRLHHSVGVKEADSIPYR